jgi:anti-sigma B factor antagonist
MSVRVRPADDATVLEVAGEVDIASCAALREALSQAAARPPHRVVVDLRPVTFMDSAGIGILVAAHKRLRAHSGRLVLVDVDGPVQRVLHLTGLLRVLTLTDDLDAALTQVAASSGT